MISTQSIVIRVKKGAYLDALVGVPVDIPGLNQFIHEIPDGAIVSIEGGVDHPKAVLVGYIIKTAMREGRVLVYVGPEGGGTGLMEQLPEWDNLMCKCEHRLKGLDLNSLHDFLSSKPLIIIDSLSYLIHDKNISEVQSTLEALRREVRRHSAIVIQLIEDEMISREMRTITGFLSDGIIQFLVRDVPDGVTRFMRIEKWMDGSSFERNIYYNYDEGNINVDLRYRVV